MFPTVVRLLTPASKQILEPVKTHENWLALAKYKIHDLQTYNRIHYLVLSAKPITHIYQSLGRVNDLPQKIQVHYSTSLSWVYYSTYNRQDY